MDMIITTDMVDRLNTEYGKDQWYILQDSGVTLSAVIGIPMENNIRDVNLYVKSRGNVLHHYHYAGRLHLTTTRNPRGRTVVRLEELQTDPVLLAFERYKNATRV